MLRLRPKVNSDPKLRRKANAIRDVLRTLEEEDLPPEKERGRKLIAEEINRALRRRPIQLARADSLILKLYDLFPTQET